MSDIPQDLRYTKTHEWIMKNDEGTLTIGITDHAQGLLGDLVFIEVPEKGTTFQEGDDSAVVESVKAASDVYAPVDGEVTAGNEVLDDAPETINNDPFGDGWIYKIKPEDEGVFDTLMNADEYKELIDSTDG